MTPRRIVDTNILIRHLVQDHESHAATARSLFEASDSGDVRLVLLSAVVAECVFVLTSFYERSREETVDALSLLLESPGIELRDSAIHLEALRIYRDTRLHFVDCLIAATAKDREWPVATFDSGIRKLPGVRVEL